MHYILLALVGLSLIGGGIYYSQMGSMGTVSQDQAMGDAVDTSKPHVMEDGSIMSAEEHDMMLEIDAKNNTTVVDAGVYEVYAPEKIALANSGPVVLFFKASWCPSCQSVDRDILSNKQHIPSGVTILTVDYDNSQDLKKKYGVTYQHTFVQVDASGNLIKKWSGSATLAALVSSIKR
jgi:thiol-disulfide isomerase/thioredoxin